MTRLLRNRPFLRDNQGHTAIEYSMIAALIAIGIITAITSIGGSVADMFASLAPALNGPAP